MSFYKVILLGESSVGKTSLLNVLRNNQEGNKKLSAKQPNPTRNVDIVNVNYNLLIDNKQVNVTLQLWDTAGTETFRATTKQYIRDAKAIVFCFDLTNGASFNELLQYWVPSCKRKGDPESEETNIELSENCIFAVIGTKLDLCYENIAKINTKSFTYITNDTKQASAIVSMIPTMEVTEESESDGTEKSESGNTTRKTTSKNIGYSTNKHKIFEDFKFFNSKSLSCSEDVQESISLDSPPKNATTKKLTSSDPPKKLSSSNDPLLNGRKKKFRVTTTQKSLHSRKDSIGEMLNSSKRKSLPKIEDCQQKYVNEIYKNTTEKIVNTPVDIHEIFLTSSLQEYESYGIEHFFMNLAITLLKENGKIPKKQTVEKEKVELTQKKQSSCCS